jgi:ketosteroid isomerase-like protein
MEDKVGPQRAERLRSPDEEYDEAFNLNDPAGVASFYVEDAVMVSPDGVFFGRPAIEKRYAEDVFQKKRCQNHVSTVQRIFAVGSEVCSVGKWSCTAHDQNGVPKELRGYYSMIRVCEGETWKIRISTYNISPTPAAKTA